MTPASQRLQKLVRDARYGLRQIRRRPAFAAVVVATLALGIGAHTAIFSILNGVLLRPLRYPAPEQLMFVTARAGIPVSVPEYLELQQFNRSFAVIGAFRTGEVNLAAGGQAQRVGAAVVDAPLLHALGLRPGQGRLFTPLDSVVTASALPGGNAVTAPVALISHELWQSAFAGRPVVGESIEIDGRAVEVVGVLPQGADLLDRHPDVWLPLGFGADERLARNNHNLFLIGRPRNEVTPAAAAAELSALVESWSARTGITPAPTDAGHVGHALQTRPLADEVVGSARRSIWVLQAAVGLLLLVAGANVIHLLLARAETRQHEFALLSALGASRSDLVRRLLAESTMLSLVGCGLGLVLARSALEVLIRAFPSSLPRIGEVALDARVMIVSIVLSLAGGALLGLAPLLHLRRDAAAGVLASATRVSSSRTGRRVRVALVIAETALAVIVAGGAGLLLRTVQNLAAVDAGFDRTRLVTFSITLPRTRYDTGARARAYQALLETLRTVPGVAGATAMTSLPLDRQFVQNATEITNHAASSPPVVGIDYQRVMSAFFDTAGIAIVQGRGFQPEDPSGAGVAVINETMARTHWAGLNPIGQRLRPAGTAPWFTVVGVATDVKQGGMGQSVGPEVYLLVDQLATNAPTTWVAISPLSMHVLVRTAVPVATLAPTITRIVRDFDPGVPVARFREMDDVFADAIRRPRLLADLVAMFGGLTLLLGAIGTYGVLSYTVTERRREIGIRMALGAARSRVLAELMRHGLSVTALGVGVGVAVALGVNRLLTPLLFGVLPTDIATLAGVVLTISLVAALACAVPAWRASRLDPNVVLRGD